MIEELIQYLSAYQDIPAESIDKDAHLIIDLGLDSIGLLGMMAQIEDKYEIEFEEDDLNDLLTIQKIADYIEMKLN